MTTDAIRESLRRILHRIAPEADVAALDPRSDLRAALDLDSMDFLRFVTLLQAEHGVEVPESDYRKVGTLDGCAAWIAAHVPAEQP